MVALAGVAASGVPLKGSAAFSAVSDHMGDQLGSIAYFDEHDADLCVLGELTDNTICIGHRGRYYFDVHVVGRSAHTCHKYDAVNANYLAALAIIELDGPDSCRPWSSGCPTCSVRKLSSYRAGSTAAYHREGPR